ncbi:hypothetical protein HD806DRAFT_15819 [Xylariaceae sp. AK1471]|nr:hypothetical protein HD806DRAFT_15819 [Xylariaceae sp. AK1471]
MDQDHIDGLLERYLHLLHEYTSLREELTALQTGMYQNIARANFAAERGVRFGQDYYDDRMQASRRLAISCKSEDQTLTQIQRQSESQKNGKNLAVILGGTIPSFTVINPASADIPVLRATAEDSEASVQVPNPIPDPGADARAESVEEESATKHTAAANRSTNTEARSAPTPTPTPTPAPTKSVEKNATATATATISKKSPSSSRNGTTTTAQNQRDPLRWFGLLTPMPLRQVQTQSIRAVEHVIPRLASVNAEMAEVEIEVRRARKRRAKAEAATINKPSQRNGQGQGQERGPGTEAVTTTRDVRA